MRIAKTVLLTKIETISMTNLARPLLTKIDKSDFFKKGGFLNQIFSKNRIFFKLEHPHEPDRCYAVRWGEAAQVRG